MPCRPHGSGGASRPVGGRSATRRRRQPTASTSRRPQRRRHHAATQRRRGARHDPGSVRLRAPRPRVDEALRRSPRSATGEDVKVLAGGQSLLPVLRLRLAAPELARRPRPDRRAARRPRRRRRDRDRRDDHARRGHPRPAGPPARAAAGRRPPRPSPTRRCGTAARSAARSRTPTRPATCRRRRWRSTRELVIAGPGGRADGGGGGLLPRLLHHRGRRGRDPRPRSGSPSTPAGARTTRSSTGSRRPGRSSAVAAAVRVEDGTIAEARVGLTNMGSAPVRAPRRRGGAGRSAGDGRRDRPRPAPRPTARPRRPTPTATRTTVGTWRGCSPDGRC